jgi:hypothetical protein
MAYEPVLLLPESLLSEYMERLMEEGPDVPDRLGEALSAAYIQIYEELTTNHGLDRNYVRALGFRRIRGRVEFFVEQDLSDVPHLPPDPGLRWTADRP